MVLRLFYWGLLLFTVPLAAQNGAYFHQIGMSDGLYQNFVRSMIQTSDGFVWVGTQLSLDRYDSHDFRHFTYQADDPHSLPRPEVFTLYEDGGGVLWAGCAGGLARYRPATEDFQRVSMPELKGYDDKLFETVHSLLEHPRGRLWVGTALGAIPLAIDSFSVAMDTLFLQQQLEWGFKLVLDMEALPGERVLLATDKGPFVMDGKTMKVSPLDFPADHTARFWMSLARLPDGRILAGTNDGLLRFNVSGDNKLIELEQQRLAAQSDGKGNTILDILLIENDAGYLATSNGLLKFAWAGEEFKTLGHYLHDEDRESSLAGNQLQCLAEVSPGWVWAGTRHGISILDKRPDFIELYSKNRLGSDICSDALKGMTTSPNGRYLVVGGNLGLTIVDLEEKTSRCYDQENLPELRNVYIINVADGPYPDSYWLMFRRGGADLLHGVESGEMRIERIMYPEAGTTGAGTYDHALTSDGLHWIASSRGLYAYDPVTGKKKVYTTDDDNPRSLPDQYIFSLLTDESDRVWLGFNKAGLARLENREEEVFTNWRSDPQDSFSLVNDMILDMHEDDRGRIWIATPAGLGVYLGEDKFRKFTEADGLPGNLIFNVLQDEHGNIWTSSPAGLAKVGLAGPEAALVVEDVFHVEDGLPIARAQYGFKLLPDGRFALAGGGVQIFHPDSLQHDRNIGPVIVTGLSLFNLAATLGEGGDIPAAVSSLDRVELRPKQNFLSFTFADLNFNPYRKVDYEYRLLGMHENWLPAQNRRHVSFPRLSYGDYKLEIRALNPALNTSGPVTSLAISMLPPWYLRWWAFLVLGAIVLGFWWVWNRHLLEQERQLVEARLEEREAFRRRSAQDFHDEAGNHLTRVGLLTEVARREEANNGNIQPILSQIDANVQVLREGMRDFIWALDPGNDNAYELLLRLKRFGQELFAHHPGRFEVDGLEAGLKRISLPADQRRHLILLFKEAMHNSLKHAPTASELQLKVEKKGDKLAFNWRDNGPGIQPNQTGEQGNGLNNMKSRAEKISGELQFNNRNPGLEVVVYLPLQ